VLFNERAHDIFAAIFTCDPFLSFPFVAH